MTQTYTLEQIKTVCCQLDLSSEIEAGFVAYSAGQVKVPPVGELCFTEPPGDTHIKYGYIKNDDYFVIKIASGFYQNPQLGLPSNSGLMLIFCQKTGIPKALLLDEGYLTDVRTAIAGAISARYLAPENPSAIGVFGTGIQARMQVQYLKDLYPCRKVVAWGRSKESLHAYKADMSSMGFDVQTTNDPERVTAQCDLIITATPSSQPLFDAQLVREGTHITAMGADTPTKQELDAKLFTRAELVVADSIPQCIERGEIARALQTGTIDKDRIQELGSIISSQTSARTAPEQISIADLTGVAVQDIQIAKAVFAQLQTQTTSYA